MILKIWMRSLVTQRKRLEPQNNDQCLALVLAQLKPGLTPVLAYPTAVVENN